MSESGRYFDNLTEIPHEISNRIPTIRVIAMPADTNAAGDIFGGWILSQMDLAGAAHAYKKLGQRVVTVGIEAMTFKKPIFVGDEVSIYTKIKKIGKTSLSIEIESWAFRREGQDYDKVTEGLFTFVMVDKDRKPMAHKLEEIKV